MYDAHSNLGYSTIVAAPFPALTGTNLTVQSGQGALFPATPFNCTVWPAGVQPLASNAEIVTVTAVVGDTFTITRAQEGTTNQPIAIGFQIANTTSVKVFTDIENSIIQFVSAGTTKAGASEVVFGDANGISFGANGQTITASAAGMAQSTQPVAASASNGSFLFSTLGFVDGNGVTFGTGAGGISASVAAGAGGVAISAAGSSQSAGTMVFSNSNNVSFGMNGSTVTASVTVASTAQSTQPVAASASNGSFLFSTLGFTNANGVTFGTSVGSLIFASVGAGVAAGSISAGTTNVALGQAVFSNSNNITFGLNGSTLTASASFSQTATPIAAGTQQATAGVSFVNSNGITFGMSNSSDITASFNGLTSQSNQAASASNGSFTFQTLGFANGNGVTFGTSAGSLITASVNTSGGGGGNLLYLEPVPAISTGTAGFNTAAQFIPFVLPMSMSLSFARIMMSMVTSSTTLATLNSATATASGSFLLSASVVLYSMGTGASSGSLSSVASSSAGMTFLNSISITNSSQQTITQGLSYLFGGTTSGLSTVYNSTQSNYALSTTLFSNMTGVRFVDFPLATSLSAGNYWLALHLSTASSTGGALSQISRGLVFPNTQFFVNSPDFGPLFMGQTFASGAGFLYAGSFTTAGSVTTNVLNTSNISSNGSNRRLYCQLLAQ